MARTRNAKRSRRRKGGNRFTRWLGFGKKREPEIHENDPIYIMIKKELKEHDELLKSKIDHHLNSKFGVKLAHLTEQVQAIEKSVDSILNGLESK